MTRFHREIFLNTPEDCKWLRGVHVKDAPPFLSYTLAGNEDSPARVDLYASREPEYNEQPIAVYEPNEDGELINKMAVEPRKVVRRTKGG